MELRKATEADSMFLFNLRNDLSVRETAFHTAEIHQDIHQRWLSSKLNSAHSQIYIAIVDGMPMGQIRFDFDDDYKRAEFDVAIVSAARGKGYGRQLIENGCQMLLAQYPQVKIIAIIKKENQASLKAFRSSGFELVGELDSDSSVYIRMEKEWGTNIEVK